jgi:Major intrinsic protein
VITVKTAACVVRGGTLVFVPTLTRLRVASRASQRGCCIDGGRNNVVTVLAPHLQIHKDDAMFGGPITGASMNPMRSLGPALVSGDLHALWLYILAPVAGASVGGLAYQFVRGEQPRPAALASEQAREERAA